MPMPPTPPGVLLVAALHSEVLPFLSRMRGRSRLSTRLIAGTLVGVPVALLRCGVGESSAHRHTLGALQRYPASRVVSLGTCGALVDDLEVGDLVTAHAMLEPADAQPIPIPGARPVVLASVPRVVDTPRARAAWAVRGAQVCEMEAAAVLEAAQGRPFLALKVVSDLAGARRPRLRGVPFPVRKALFEILAYRLVNRRLAPAIEVWLRGA